MNAKWNKTKNWDKLDDHTRNDLKEIEHVAKHDMKKAYRMSLLKQAEHALTDDEAFFKVYAAVLSLLYKKQDMMANPSDKNYTEADYTSNIWSVIFTAIFEDPHNHLLCKWGESVPEESSKSKKESQHGQGSKIGDKIDLRICTQVHGKLIDLASVEFAKHHQDSKFYSDHRKILREGKTIADQFYRHCCLKKREKRVAAGCCIQIAGVEGQVLNVKFADQGLYVASYLGSLRLPSSQVELKKTRVLLERLFTVKRNLLFLKNCYRSLQFDKSATTSKSMEKKLNMNRSPYTSSQSSTEETPPDDTASEQEMATWTRGNWFPPSPKRDTVYQGDWSTYLFSCPPH